MAFTITCLLTFKVEILDFIGDTITKMIGKRIMYCDLVN